MGRWEIAAKEAIDRVAEARWLEPDAELEALTPSAVQWVEERLDEFVSALALHDPTLSREAPSVRFARSLPAFCRQWEHAWSALDAQGEGPHNVWFPTLWRIASSDMQSAPRLYSVFADELLRAALRAMDHSPALLACVPANGASHGQVLLARHLAFLEARTERSLELRSPWEPLLELWLRGAWPMLLPGNEVLVYVPVRGEGGSVVPDPDDPQGDPLLFRKEFLGRSFGVPIEGTLRVLGLGPPPAVRGNVSQRARLVRVHPKPEWQYVLGREERVGRGDDVDLRMFDPSVELRHARITWNEPRFVLLDTGGGVLRNGTAVKEVSLVHGDLLEFGRIRCRFEAL